MPIYRINSDIDLTFYKGEEVKHLFNDKEEWLYRGKDRIDEPAWVHRYEYESKILNDIFIKNNTKKIIEIGSGPGSLGQMLISKNNELNYTFVDQQGAYKIFIEREFKGKFKVKDMSNEFDISDLDNDYDILIANDFLEHIFNPSAIMLNSYKILKENGKLFVSVPNWRMGHTFIYRGLFDFDNFIYFALTHGFKISQIWDSCLRCNGSSKLSSETELPDNFIDSWNWYMLFDKIS